MTTLTGKTVKEKDDYMRACPADRFTLKSPGYPRCRGSSFTSAMRFKPDRRWSLHPAMEPNLALAQLEICCIRASCLAIVDKVGETEPVAYDRLLHIEAPCGRGKSLPPNTLKPAGLKGEVVWS